MIALLLLAAPLVADLTSWRAGPTVFAVGALTALGVYALATTRIRASLSDG